MEHPFPKDALVEGMPFEAYLADPAINASSLKAIDRAPAYYREQQEAEGTSSIHMAFGTHAHCGLWEPERFAEHGKERPGAPRNTKAGKEAFAEFQTTLRPGDFVLEPGDFNAIQGLRAALFGNSEVAGLLKEGVAEVSIRWDDRQLGGTCKARPDFVSKSGVCLDLKTCQDARESAFVRDAMKLGMPIQAAHYLAFGEQTGLYDGQTFGFLAIEKKPPYLNRLYWAGEEFLRVGRELRAAAMRVLQACERDNVWPGLEESGVLELPPYLVPYHLRPRPEDSVQGP